VTTRRALLTGAGGLLALGSMGGTVRAEEAGHLVLAFPADVPLWDPTARALAPAQSLYKMVFDQPIGQRPDLAAAPGLVKAWRTDAAGTALELELRDDVVFHDGTPMTAEDIRYTFFERPRRPVAEGGSRLDATFLWRKLTDVEVASPTRAVMRFSSPMPSAVPWLHFMCSFVIPKAYLERVGAAGFQAKPVGTGPYKVVEYQQGARIVLEAFDRYWAGRPAIPRVTVEIVRDPSARVAAVQSRNVDLAVDVPIREAQRLSRQPGLSTRIDPTADIMLLQITRAGAFADERVRLAAHHAIDKAAISKAFFQDSAKPISVPAAHGTAGYPEDFSFPFSEEKAKALLAEAGYGPGKPVTITLATTNGVFPSDYDVARAMVAMWKKVGIEAAIETIELTTYQERLRGGKLPEATMYQWGNAAGDPEMYAGYLLDPKSIFSAFKSDDLGERIAPLLVEPDQDKRLAGYRALNRYAVERGYTIPLLQGVKTVVYAGRVAFAPYQSGYVLPQAYALKA
jgi:peptide/nickel transport system substrate-binding protein